MQRINLSFEKAAATEHHTSRGNQPKWFYRDKWYKQDILGYEGLAEYLATEILQQSNIKDIADFVSYDPILISVDGAVRPGCVSRNFRAADEVLIPVQKLYRMRYGQNFSEALAHIHDLNERILYFVRFVEEETGLKNFGAYITAILELDSLILNEDRHFNNISVIRNEKDGTFRLCPVFDNGIALLSDLYTYPMDRDIYKTIDKLEAKPFSRSFREQVEAAEMLFGYQLQFQPCRNLIQDWFDVLADYYNDEILTRAENVLREQFRVNSVK